MLSADFPVSPGYLFLPRATAVPTFYSGFNRILTFVHCIKFVSPCTHLSNIIYTVYLRQYLSSAPSPFNPCAPWSRVHLLSKCSVLTLPFLKRKYSSALTFAPFYTSHFVSRHFHHWDVFSLLFSLSPLISCFFFFHPVPNILLSFLSVI